MPVIETARLVTGAAVANEPSCHLLERLGMEEIGRHTGSFTETEDGKPVEFQGISFAISSDEWLALGRASTDRSGQSS